MADAATARVAVIGGGWAGCAAAVTLAAAGVPVTVFEQAKTLGGRARRIVQDGIALDNGQHVLLGAYARTLALVDAVHDPANAAGLFHRLPLTLRPFGGPREDSVELTAWNASAPLNLALGALSARGLSWRERWSLIAGFRRLQNAGIPESADESVAARFASSPARAFAEVWKPLCLSALNTPPERASARTFAHVLRSAFGGTTRDSDLLVPAVDLSACFPDAAARFVAARSGSVRCGVAVRGIAIAGDAVTLKVGGGVETFAGAVVAVGPHQLASTVGSDGALADAWSNPLSQISRFTYESITTIYLGLTHRVAFAVPMLRLDDGPGQWAFDRSSALGRDAPPGTQGLIAVVISASGPHDALDQAMLALNVESQLRRLAPDLPSVTFTRVIAERRATYACTPALARPAGGRVASGIYLAGDYVDPEFPATLEAATRSGVAAADALIADCAGAVAARGSTRAP